MPYSKEIITVNSRKYDGAIHRQWKAKLIRRNGTYLEFIGIFDQDINHNHLGVIRRATISYEYYWLDRGFNVFRFHEPEGELRNFYCNINLPPKFENNILDYIDLDIDVLVWRDFSFQILDVDEFEENAIKFSYPNDLILDAKKNVEELIRLIENREFPFNYEIKS